jgi:hypothetical protein
MRQACVLMRQSCLVHFVEGPNGERSTLWQSQRGARSIRCGEAHQRRAGAFSRSRVHRVCSLSGPMLSDMLLGDH